MKQILSIITLSFFLASSLYAKKDNFSLVISGGISLGAYEAGYNWALIKALTYSKNSTSLPIDSDLVSISGASAGAINTLMSAMQWCAQDNFSNQTTNNMFYDAWINIGLDELISKEVDGKRNSLFTQTHIARRAKALTDSFDGKKKRLKPGCSVPIGMSVTKVKPAEYKIQSYTIKNQHFVFPLKFSTDDMANVHIKKLEYFDKTHEMFSRSLVLKTIEKNPAKVVDILLASSAFPIAFPKRKLDFEFLNLNKYPNYKEDEQNNLFADGGSYDNVPLQLAMDLRKNRDEKTSYIFMIPTNYKGENQKRVQKKKADNFVDSFLYLFTASDIQSSQHLYNTLLKHFDNKSKNRLLLSQRHKPITGIYLGHFGAFFDESFRIYDYHVGVYDAIKNISKYLHESKNISYFKVEEELKRILLTDNKSRKIYDYFDKKTIDVDSNIKAIYNSLVKIENSTKKEFDFIEFIKYLSDDIDFKPSSEYLIYAMKNPQTWYKKPLSKMIKQVQAIEENADEHSKLSKILGLSSVVINPLISDNESSSFTNSKYGFYNIIPHEVATTYYGGAVSFGWNHVSKPIVDIPVFMESKLSLVLDVSSNKDSSSHIRGDLSFVMPVAKIYDIGAGVSYFYDRNKIEGSSRNSLGINIHADFLDLWRLTYVKRLNYHGQDQYLFIGVNDLPGLMYWLFK